MERNGLHRKVMPCLMLALGIGCSADPEVAPAALHSAEEPLIGKDSQPAVGGALADVIIDIDDAGTWRSHCTGAFVKVARKDAKKDPPGIDDGGKYFGGLLTAAHCIPGHPAPDKTRLRVTFVNEPAPKTQLVYTADMFKRSQSLPPGLPGYRQPVSRGGDYAFLALKDCHFRPPMDHYVEMYPDFPTPDGGEVRLHGRRCHGVPGKGMPAAACATDRSAVHKWEAEVHSSPATAPLRQGFLVWVRDPGAAANRTILQGGDSGGVGIAWRWDGDDEDGWWDNRRAYVNSFTSSSDRNGLSLVSDSDIVKLVRGEALRTYPAEDPTGDDGETDTLMNDGAVSPIPDYDPIEEVVCSDGSGGAGGAGAGGGGVGGGGAGGTGGTPGAGGAGAAGSGGFGAAGSGGFGAAGSGGFGAAGSGGFGPAGSGGFGPAGSGGAGGEGGASDGGAPGGGGSGGAGTGGDGGAGGPSSSSASSGASSGVGGGPVHVDVDVVHKLP